MHTGDRPGDVGWSRLNTVNHDRSVCPDGCAGEVPGLPALIGDLLLGALGGPSALNDVTSEGEQPADRRACTEEIEHALDIPYSDP